MPQEGPEIADLGTAATMYREMDMAFWLAQAETVRTAAGSR